MTRFRGPTSAGGPRLRTRRLTWFAGRALPIFMRISAGAVLIGVLGMSVWSAGTWMAHSPLFRLNTVEVASGTHVTREEILDLVSLTPNANIFSLDLAKVSESIKQHPWVKTASVRRVIPDRLVVSVTEFEPLVVARGERAFLVDSAGVVFKEVEGTEAEGLPVITGISQTDTGRWALPDKHRRALDLIRLASRGTRTLGVNSIRQIQVEPDGGMVVYAGEGRAALRFSPHGAIKEQFERAEKILFQLYSSGDFSRVTMIDLDYGPNKALARMEDEGSRQ